MSIRVYWRPVQESKSLNDEKTSDMLIKQLLEQGELGDSLNREDLDFLKGVAVTDSGAKKLVSLIEKYDVIEMTMEG